VAARIYRVFCDFSSRVSEKQSERLRSPHGLSSRERVGILHPQTPGRFARRSSSNTRYRDSPSQLFHPTRCEGRHPDKPLSFSTPPVARAATPTNLSDAILAHPAPPVQAARSRATPCCALLRWAAARYWGGSRRRRARAAGAGGGRENAPGVFAGLRSGKAGAKMPFVCPIPDSQSWQFRCRAHGGQSCRQRGWDRSRSPTSRRTLQGWKN
jgi:hypothetical protein